MLKSAQVGTKSGTKFAPCVCRQEGALASSEVKTRQHRTLFSRIAPSPPATADGEDASPAAVVSSAHGGAETAAPYEGPNGSENAEQEPARPEGLEADAGEVPVWRQRFSTPEKMWEAFRNEQTVRGRLANLVGDLRAKNEELALRLVAHEALVLEEIVRRREEARGAGSRVSLASHHKPAGESPNGSDELREGIPSPFAGDAAPAAPDSPEAG